MTEPAAAPEVVVDEHRRVDGDRARLLITNDDGIESPGLRALAHALAEAHDVVVVTPAVDASGSGTSIGRFGSDGGVDLRRADFDGVAAYPLAGPPGLAVTAAALGAFGGPPDLVVSGINAGINTGHSVIHSGTVGAVLTARTFGSGGIAVSLDHSDPWQWETAATIAVSATGWMLVQGAEPLRPQRQRSCAAACRGGWDPLGRTRPIRTLPGGDRRRGAGQAPVRRRRIHGRERSGE